ncbi:MAG: hypothetical protein CL610_27060 [Anaerolineaceae bacterium]|nr:hypothetical protein [Anaerolineaceae bacterium]
MLAAELGFNEDDLRANQEGRMTVQQRNRVFVRRRMLIIALLLLTVCIGVISALVIVGVLTGVEISEFAILLALGGEVVTVGLAYLVWSLHQHFRTYLKPGRVQRVEGQAVCYQLRERQNEKARTTYFLRIDQHEFEVSDRVISALTDGARYAAYYVPHRQTLLSAERLDTSTSTAGPPRVQS